MVYSRNTYEGNFLTKDDFIRGLGYDTSLLIRLRKVKNQENVKEDYYHEAGMSIDGTIRVKKFHPLLNKILIDNNENKNKRELIIESIHKHWHIGYYWCLVYRTVGTKSHGTLYFKNINSIDSTILESIDRARTNITFKDTTLNWDKF